MYNRIRLITAIISLAVILFMLYPMQTSITFLAIVIAYFIIKNIPNAKTYKNEKLFDNQTIRNRNKALEAAKLYLAPYNTIWGNLRLTNNYVSLRLSAGGTNITASELGGNRRKLEVIYSKVHEIGTLWEMLCYRFDHQLTFDGLMEILDKYSAVVNIDNNQKSFNQAISDENSFISNENINESTNEIKIVPMEQIISDAEKTDINNASVTEISKLPGISLILAKKLIKKREEIRGFKSVEEVTDFLKLNEHATEKLRQMIKISKMEGADTIKHTEERNIDL